MVGRAALGVGARLARFVGGEGLDLGGWVDHAPEYHPRSCCVYAERTSRVRLGGNSSKGNTWLLVDLLRA
jgi:hypothetical protein